MANRTTHRGHKKIRRALWDLIIHHVDSPDVTIEALEFENERQWRQQRRKLLNKLHRLRLWPILRWIAKIKIQRSLESNTGFNLVYIGERVCTGARGMAPRIHGPWLWRPSSFSLLRKRRDHGTTDQSLRRRRPSVRPSFRPSPFVRLKAFDRRSQF